ncbi:hypothetical protein ACJX0J_038002, partial [Zea mays]
TQDNITRGMAVMYMYVSEYRQPYFSKKNSISQKIILSTFSDWFLDGLDQYMPILNRTDSSDLSIYMIYIETKVQLSFIYKNIIFNLDQTTSPKSDALMHCF